jgi:hypothetical protein
MVAVNTSVGMTRLELATTRPPDAYANQLRHIPKLGFPSAKALQNYYFMPTNGRTIMPIIFF